MAFALAEIVELGRIGKVQRLIMDERRSGTPVMEGPYPVYLPYLIEAGEAALVQCREGIAHGDDGSGV